MSERDFDWLGRAERAELCRLLDQTLLAEPILLYDAAGNPILERSDIRIEAETAWREHVHQLLDDILTTFPPNTIPSTEELAEALRKLSQSDPKYTFDVVDGKLSIPISVTVGDVKIKGNIPLYRLAVLAAGVTGFWLARKGGTNRPPELPAPSVESQRFPTWRTITLGTHRSSEDLATELNARSVKISGSVARILEKIELAPSETVLELVSVSINDLGFDSLPDLQQIYERAEELGLSCVPAEVGPQLLLQYNDQPMGEWRFVGMQPIVVSRNRFLMFYQETPWLGALYVICGEDGRLWPEAPVQAYWNSEVGWIFAQSK